MQDSTEDFFELVHRESKTGQDSKVTETKVKIKIGDMLRVSVLIVRILEKPTKPDAPLRCELMRNSGDDSFLKLYKMVDKEKGIILVPQTEVAQGAFKRDCAELAHV